jgi:hypothetical protein
MKQLFLFGAMLIFIGACTFTSTKPPINKTIDTFSQFTIISYLNNGVEFKAKYADYSFQFGANGQIVANKSGILSQGSWSASNDSLIIRNFTVDPLDGLNTRWVLTSILNDVIVADYTNGLDVKRLQFKKQ